jgi:cystathionine gamma-lyase
MAGDDSHDFESIAVGAADDRPATATRDVVAPVNLTSTYGLDAAGYPEDGFTYARHGNPTRATLERRLGELTGADHVLAAASGMAAISTVCLSVLDPGDRVVASDSLFGGTKQFFDRFLSTLGFDVAYVDATDPDEVAAALDDDTELVWVETPTNPLLKVVDVAALGDLTAAHGATLAVDNTFVTPYAQRPLELGADVSVFSTTKFVNGHSDSVGGAVTTDDAALADEFEFVLEDVVGAALPPFDCYLVLRGLKTLAARMDRHERTATEIAAFLADHDAVRAVNYPGLDSHPGHDVAAAQMDNYGGVVSFEVAGGAAEARAFVEDLSVCTLAFSLGGVETLVEHTPSMSAAPLSEAERAEAGIGDSLVRLSVGLESAEDLVSDLAGSLEKL